MATKQSKERIDHSYQVWDAYKHKLLLYIIDAKDVAAKDSNGKSDPYVVIEHGKYKKQTKIIDKTLNPVWNECFFIQADPTVPVKLEMWDHDVIGSADYMGHTHIDLKSIPQDRIIDIFPPLQPRKKKEKVSGAMHIRIYHSSARESRQHGNSPLPDPAGPQFLYRPFKSAFKPGDLIGYSGYGIISGLQKVLTGNPITSVGMVVYLPNKWTTEVEPYVIEMTRNVNKNIDVFSETNNKVGIYIFHLYERFHQFHGSDLVHFPLVHPLPNDMYKKVVEKVWDWHKKNAYLAEGQDSYRYGPYVQALYGAIKRKKNWSFEKHERLVEAASFDFVARILKECGAHKGDLPDPADILRSNLYGPPVLIRQTPGESPIYFHSAPVIGPAPAPALVVPPPSYSSLPVYSPPSQSSMPAPPMPAPSAPPAKVLLSQLEMDALAGLLDGVVLDDQLVVTKQEFRQRMISKGITVFQDEARFDQFYNMLDSDEDGKVDLRELVCGLAIFVDGAMDQKLLSAFKVFDRDGDKFIKKSELRALLSTILKAANRGVHQPTSHSALVEQFVTQIFSEYDKNNDGKLSLEEYMNAAHSNTAVGNLFLTVSSFT